MNTKKLTQAISIFSGLTIAGIGMAAGAQLVPAAFAQTVLVAVGSAIFGAGLAFFLIRMSALLDD
jgi:uncharacterized membrane protein YhiD involved in acid resistance